jgi:hypothetical protein
MVKAELINPIEEITSRHFPKKSGLKKKSDTEDWRIKVLFKVDLH